MNGATLVLGVGNPYLSDDAVGLRIAAAVAERCAGRSDVTVRQLHAAGLPLVEALEGYRRALVVDAMVTGSVPPGSIGRFAADATLPTRHATSPHDLSLATGLATGRLLGLELPEEIRIWGVEAAEVSLFAEELTPAVAAAVPVVVAELLAALEVA